MSISLRDAAIGGVVVLGAVLVYTLIQSSGGSDDTLQPADDERPPIIVSGGGSIIFESLPHPDGTGKDKWAVQANGHYLLTDANPSHKQPGHYQVLVTGSSTAKCGKSHSDKNVASLDIAYGALGSVESTWTVVKIIPADPKKDLELDLGTETSVSSQWYDSTLVLQPDNKAAILRKVTLRDAASKELACEFDGTNPTASIMIAQRKQ